MLTALSAAPTAPSTGSIARILKGNYGMSAFYKSIDTILWGRKTYEMALGFQEKGIARIGIRH